MTEFKLQNDNFMRVDCLAPSVFRIRVNNSKNFSEGGLMRYGIVRADNACQANETMEKNIATVTTGEAALTVDLSTGALQLTAGTRKILQANAPAVNGGFRQTFALTPEERLFGLGDNGRESIERRGRKYPVIVRNVSSYIPIPFLMSTNGWALFMNTTWFHYVDAGEKEKDVLSIYAPKGALDYVLMAGDNLANLLAKYTAITGRPALLPRWAYGLTFVCDERGVRARDVLYEAYEFRRQGIPCDVIGLEPDWMEKHYDYSVDKDWSQERFHIPYWRRAPTCDRWVDKNNIPTTFAAGLKNMGFKLSLWLCCDYDFSEHEERMLGAAVRLPVKSEAKNGNEVDAEDHFKDPHFVPHYVDTITKRGERWFEHLKKFVDDGARAFKLDGANQICFHPDRKWANGMDDEEMHNLYPLLYNKEMTQGFREYAKKRALVYSAGGYAGIQQYSATWAGDTGGGIKPLVASLNLGLSGHSNTTADMDVWNAEGIHFGFLLPWSQILSWHMYNQPWFQGDPLCAMIKDYAKLRYRLLPYLYSLAYEAHQSGLPMMRAMSLVFPDDAACDGCLTQYMLGSAFLVSAFTNRGIAGKVESDRFELKKISNTVYLPAGQWIDYWTGKVYDGAQLLEAVYPENRGGMLLVRAGSLIPCGDDIDYCGQKQPEHITLEVFPGGRGSSFLLYEDDGETLAHENGEYATTRMNMEETPAQIRLTIEPRQGNYAGMPNFRSFTIKIFSADPMCPETAGMSMEYDGTRQMYTVGPIADKGAPISLILKRGKINEL